MFGTMTQQWKILHAEYTAAHQNYLNQKVREEEREQGQAPTHPNGDSLEAHLAAKGNLAKAQRAMHEFCQKHAEFC